MVRYSRPAFFIALLLLVSALCDNLSGIREANLKKRLAMGHELFFEQNRGQVDARYRFLARDPFGVFLLAGNEFVYGRGRDAVEVKFEGAGAQARISGLDQQPGRVNYLLGKDMSKWIRGVSSYSRVAVKKLYPGIDAVYYGSNASLEADFVVQPGSRPERVRLRVEGSGRPSINAAGDLEIPTRNGLFALRKPRAYQRGGGGRRPVACRYAMLGPNEVGFAASGYDPTQPLVIDPVLSYSTYLGGGNSTAVRVALDSQGNAYVAGATSSSTYPATSGAVAPPAAGPFNDVLVTKFNSQGAIVYSTHVGGSHDDIGLGIAVDALGQAHVTGVTGSPDFPGITKPYQGKDDAFAFALNAAGNNFVYSTLLGGSGPDIGTAIALDAQGNAWVAGATASTNFPTVNPLQASMKGSPNNASEWTFLLGNAFVAKLSPTGSLLFSTYYGGTNNDVALAIAVDPSGAPYVAGFTTSADFPLQSPLQARFGGSGANSQIITGDAFVFKLSPDGSRVVYSTYLGGSADDVAVGIAVDASGNAYVAGSTFSSNFPTVNAMQSSYGGQGASDYFRMSSGDAFVAKINPPGSALAFSTYLGGSDDDRAFAIAVDGAGNIHVAGNTASSNFPVTSDAAQKKLGGVGVVDTGDLLAGGYVLAPVGMGDAFYAVFAPSGTLAYNTYLGGAADDLATGLAVDAAGDAYLSGNTASTNFPLAGSSYQTQLGPLIAQDSTGLQITSLLYGDAFFAVFQAPAAAPVIAPAGIISAGQFGAFRSVAPGSWIEIYGSNLAADTRAWAGSDFVNGQAPTSLDHTSVTIGGQPAFIDYISPGQVNAQVPSNVATGMQPVVVQTAAGNSAPSSVMVNPVEPGLLAPGTFSLGGKQYVVAFLSDGNYVLPFGAIGSSRPAAPGDTIVLYGVGFGPVTPAIPAGEIVRESNMLSPGSGFQIEIGGAAAKVAYAGLAPNYVGLYQFNIVVPNVPSGNAVPVTFTVAGTNNSQTLYTAVQ